MMRSLFILLLSFFAFGAQALGENKQADKQEAGLAGRNFDEAKEAQVKQISRKRLYSGGRDEADLKVQTQIINPVRKVAPTIDVNAATAEPSSED